jgi:hypothetical protein
MVQINKIFQVRLPIRHRRKEKVCEVGGLQNLMEIS